MPPPAATRRRRGLWLQEPDPLVRARSGTCPLIQNVRRGLGGPPRVVAPTGPAPAENPLALTARMVAGGRQPDVTVPAGGSALSARTRLGDLPPRWVRRCPPDTSVEQSYLEAIAIEIPRDNGHRHPPPPSPQPHLSAGASPVELRELVFDSAQVIDPLTCLVVPYVGHSSRVSRRHATDAFAWGHDEPFSPLHQPDA